MKKKLQSFSYNWPLIVGITVSVLLLGLLYGYNLSTVGPANSGTEQAAVTMIDSGKEIRDNILYAPHQFFGYILYKLDVANTAALRLVSVTTTITAIITLFLVLKQWFSFRIAILSTSLFATSSWVLFQARWAGPEAMLLLVIPAMLLTASLLKEREHDYLIPVTSFLAVACLYVPGVWLVFFGGVVLLFENLKLAWRRFGNSGRVLWAFSVLVPLIPLIYGLLIGRNVDQWLGIPAGGLTPKGLLNNLLWLPNQLLGSGLSDGLRWLPGTPVIDVATLGLALMGAIFVIRDNRYPVRRLALLILAIICLFLIAVQGPVYISLLLPLIYMFVASGLTFLLEQWFHVFPKNPLARSFGVVLVTLLVAFVCFYHVARYHYVWPRADETSHQFKG